MIETERTEEKEVAGSSNIDEYWALKEPEKLFQEMKKRRREYLEYFRESGLLSRIKSAYACFHGLYYNGDQIGDARISAGGEEGEWDLVPINQLRSVLSLLKTYVCAPDIAWDAIAKKSSYSTIEATKSANEYLDALSSSPDSMVQQARRCAVEEAIVLSAGYGWVYYDHSLGRDKDADENGTIYKEGDVRLLSPSFLDVAYSLDVEFKESPWVTVRRKENKFDLIAQFPSLKTEILKLSCETSDGLDDVFELGTKMMSGSKRSNDSCWVYYFYHRETPAMPKGRCMRAASAKAVFKDEELPGCVPVHQLLPAKWLLSSFGYCMAWDLVGPQEALHLAANIVITNQDRFGGNHVQFPAGMPVRIGEVEGVGTVFQTDGDIKSVQLLNNPAELLKSVEMWGAVIEKLSGINASARGQPTPGMHAARAIEFTEQRAQQSVSDIAANVRQFTAEIGTSILKVHAHEGSESRDYNSKSPTGENVTKSISKATFASMDEVGLSEGNPALSTIEGRVKFAENLVERGILKDPSMITNVMKTGDLKPLTELDENQQSTIKAENELLLQGQEIPPPLDYDYHPGHIRGHMAAASSPDTRGGIAMAFLGSHLAQHFAKMEDPMLMARLAILYQNQPPLPALPPSSPQGTQPGQAGASPGGPPGPPVEPRAPEPAVEPEAASPQSAPGGQEA